MSTGSQPKPIFLDGQTLSLMRPIEDLDLLKKIICKGYIPEPDELKGRRKELWDRYPRRKLIQQAAGDDPWKRVAVICDAGMGKTTNTHWLAAQFHSAKGSRQIPLYLRMDDHAALSALQREFATAGSLLEWMSLLVCGAADGDQGRYQQALKRYQASGRITLILDGLDHVIGEKGFAESLKRVLESVQWKKCPVWISGRPSAIRDGWKQLFATPNWRFLRINPLPEKEISRAMCHATGRNWYKQFPPETRWMLATPRLLRLICSIRSAIAEGKRKGLPPNESVRRLELKTPADVYHRAYFEKGDFDDPDTWGLLAQGLIGKPGKIGPAATELLETNLEDKIERMALLLGAIAFSMHAVNSSGAKPEPNTSGLDMKTLKQAALGRLLGDGHCTAPDFERDLDLLQRMNNSTLDHLLLRETSREAWIFHDRTVQSFFAAYWAMKYGSSPDRTLMKKWIIDAEGERLTGFAEFWRFAAQMPQPLVDEEKWLEVFTPCYAPPEELAKLQPVEKHWRREMICHSFAWMDKRSPGLKGTIAKWRAVWLQLVAKHGSDRQLEIFETIRNGFRRCPPEPGLTKPQSFLMGSPLSEAGRFRDEKQRPVQVTPFELHEFPVTNEQYELFDPVHREQRDRYSQQDDQPVLYVSFWDSWCFAKWCGYRLPMEEEWEYACRAGTTTVFWFGDELNGEEANCDGNYPYGTQTKGPYLQRTTTLNEERYQANPWGLYDMHGNVWEWCDSLYDSEASARVLRGGGWLSHARRCRSAYRDCNGPDDRNSSVGFRLAAVPRVGAKQSE